jgi:hypothetical protein
MWRKYKTIGGSMMTTYNLCHPGLKKLRLFLS